MSFAPSIECPDCGQSHSPDLTDEKMILQTQFELSEPFLIDEVSCECGLRFVVITEVKITRRAARIEEPQDG